MSRKPENAIAGEETAAESRVRVKQLKQRSRSTGEDGIQKIKVGFPYFDILSKERRESTMQSSFIEMFEEYGTGQRKI